VECVASAIDAVQIQKLLETGFKRGRQPVRLLGVGIRLGDDGNEHQLHLFATQAALSQN
jgi:DNA polymerase-4